MWSKPTVSPEEGAWFRDKRVLILGGAGFIGATLAHALAPACGAVTIVDGFLPDTGANRANLVGLPDAVRVIDRDLARLCGDDGGNEGSNDGGNNGFETLVAGQDVIFNLAAQVGHQASMEDPHRDLAINTAMPLAVLEACRRVNPDAAILYASTRQIYGRPDYLPVDERHPLRPVDVNGIHKMAGEAYHTLYHRVYGLNTVALRLTNVYGPRLRIKDARQTFLGIWLRRVVEGAPFEVWGGAQRRDLSYVDDVVSAMLAAVSVPAVRGRVFNIGADEVVSLTALADRLIRIAGTGTYRQHEFPPDRAKIDIGDYWADDRAFRAATGWSPTVALDTGLARTLAYVRTHWAAYV